MDTQGFTTFAAGDGGVAPLSATVRPATDVDIPGILDINARAGRPANTPGSLALAISDPRRLVVVATVGDNLAGWAKTHYWGSSDGEAPAGHYLGGEAPAGHYLGGVTVLPDVRRRGAATALTGSRLNWIWQRSETAWYVVNVDNLASIALHRRWGFSEVARGRSFHTTQFSGGTGLLMRAARPHNWRAAMPRKPGTATRK